MAKLPVIIAPDPRLKLTSAPIERVDDRMRKLVNDLLETMYAAPGIGLSAVQVGIAKRLIVIDVARDGEPPAPLCLINPEITWQSDDLVAFDEGCLSFPDHFAEIERPAEVKLRYVDADDRRQELHADGLLARCVQHEIDHLEGILLVDYLSALRRNIILRKLTKIRKAKSPPYA